ncbi:MAG: glycosyltransferase family 4 protein [Bacteroidales bacterium]|nr:glycosyltransferase family 4 protein [Bacteroidales bacterium]
MTDKLRVLFVLPLPPPVHGSAVVSSQIKHSVIVNDAFCCDWVNLSTSRSTEELWKRKPVKLFRFLASFFKTFALLLTHRYDLCYLSITCHGEPFLKDAPFVLLCKLFGRRVVIHQHNKGMAGDVSRWPYSFILPWVYRNSKVILLSKILYSDIERIVPESNVLICPNGIKVSGDYEKRTGRAKVPGLLFLSNLIESKGVLVLLDALQILKKRNYAFNCTFVGGQTREISFERFSNEVRRRNLEDSVICRGPLFGDEKVKCLRAADIFVFPSFYANECFPLVVLEAMSYGLPVVSTGEGGIPDMVEDGITGLITEKNNSRSLSDAIARLLDDNGLSLKLGEAGRLRLEKMYTEEIFERNILTCLNRCI